MSAIAILKAAKQMREALDWLQVSAKGEPLCFCEPSDRDDLIKQYGAERVNHSEYCDKARAAVAAYDAATKGVEVGSAS